MSTKKYKGKFASTKSVHWRKRRKRKPKTKTSEDLVTCDRESSVEIWNLEKDLCRCCHTEGSFGDLAKPNLYLEKVEIYSDMLRDCFDIEVDLVPGELCVRTYKICEACILMLRNALTFKKQVQDCEKKFMELYHKNAIKVLNNKQSTKSVVEEELPEHILIDLEDKEDISQIDHHNVDEDDDRDGDEATMSTYLQYPTPDVQEELQKIAQALVASGKNILAADVSTDLKEGDKSQMNHRNEDDDDDDDDFYWKEDEVVINEKLEMKRDSPRTINEEKGEEAAKEKKGDESMRTIELQEGDYRRDGDKYACCRCEMRYNSKWAVACHIQTKHFKLPYLTCQYCPKGFMSRGALTTHKLKDHNIDERHYCKACEAKFSTKVTLGKHMKAFHMLGKKHKCELCEFESFNVEIMSRHKVKHKTSRDYHCRFCKKSFLRKNNLNVHERIHTGDRRKVCKVCSQAFVQKASLNYHMTKYHPNVNF